MPMLTLAISTGFYQSPSLPLSAQRCINWIPIVPETDSKALSERALLATPGITQFANLGGDPNRGAQVMAGTPYFVNGNSLFSVDSAGSSTNHGTIPGTGRVSMANNGTFLVVLVPGTNSKAYVFDKSDSSLTKITDGDWAKSDTVVQKDGYFIFTSNDGTKFFISNLNQPLVYTGLDFGSAEINPDPIVAAHVNHNELFILGEDTIEIFQNVGGSGFPFTRVQGANIQKGCHARHAIVEFDNTFLFVGGGLNEESAIWRVSGSSSAQKVSTDAIDYAIQEFTDEEIAEAFAITFAHGGQFFAAFTFESTRIPSKTFVYNATTSAHIGRQVWHELQTGITDDRWRVQAIVKAYGKLLCADNVAGKIGYLDRTAATEYDDTILRQITSQPFHGDGLPIFSGDLELTLENGNGLTTGQGSDPQIRYDFSDDGGRTFSSQFSRSMGKIG